MANVKRTCEGLVSTTLRSSLSECVFLKYAQFVSIHFIFTCMQLLIHAHDTDNFDVKSRICLQTQDFLYAYPKLLNFSPDSRSLVSFGHFISSSLILRSMES